MRILLLNVPNKFMGGDSSAEPPSFGRPISKSQETDSDDDASCFTPGLLWTTGEVMMWIILMCWKIVAQFYRTIGFGRNPCSCMSIRQRYWVSINSRILERNSEFTDDPVVAQNAQNDIWNARYAAKAVFLKCKILNSIGEPDFVWDACQKLVFLASNGYFYIERHGTITADGHFLILHHLVMVPPLIASKFVPIEYTDFMTCLIHSSVQTYVFIMNWIRDVISLPEEEENSIFQSCCDDSELRRCAESVVLKEEKRFSCATEWSGKNLLSDNCIGQLEDNLVQPSPQSVYSPGALQETRDMTEYLDEGVIENCGFHSSPRDLILPPNSLIDQTSSRFQTVVFQHGLLESSLNWFAPAAPDDSELPIKLLPSFGALAPWLNQIVRSIATKYLRFNSDVRNALPEYRMRNSLPFYIIFESMKSCSGVRFDMWFGNTRGNCYTRGPPRPTAYNYLPPLGFRSSDLADIFALVETFGQSWTYHDIAIHDVDATFRGVVQASGAVGKGFRPILIGFSQGAATYLLSSAFRREVEKFSTGLLLTKVDPVLVILLSPPIFIHPHNPDSNSLFQEDKYYWAARTAAVRTLGKPQSVIDFVPSKLGNLVTKFIPSERFVAFFFNLAKRWLGWTAVFVEGATLIIPNKWFPLVGDIFVRDIVRFYTDKLSKSSRRWLFPLTPSGFTSFKNMDLHLSRMNTNEKLGGRFGMNVQLPLNIHRDRIVNLLIEQEIVNKKNLDLFSEKPEPPTVVWLGGSDNIAWPEMSAQFFLSEFKNAKFERHTVEQIRLETSDCSSKSERGKRDFVVHLVDGLGHLDFIWSSERRYDVYPQLWKEIEEKVLVSFYNDIRLEVIDSSIKAS